MQATIQSSAVAAPIRRRSAAQHQFGPDLVTPSLERTTERPIFDAIPFFDGAGWQQPDRGAKWATREASLLVRAVLAELDTDRYVGEGLVEDADASEALWGHARRALDRVLETMNAVDLGLDPEKLNVVVNASIPQGPIWIEIPGMAIGVHLVYGEGSDQEILVTEDRRPDGSLTVGQLNCRLEAI